MNRILFSLLLALLLLPHTHARAAGLNVPILLYHRLGPTVADSMTVTTPVFEKQLRYLKENGYTVIPLKRLIARLDGTDKAPLPAKPVVIVADDAHKSVYTDMLPLLKKYQVPVTLYTYPSAISNASYAMTWDQLREADKSGLIDVQSHTFWHPNFRRDKKKLSAADYDKLVDTQLSKAKKRLEKELGKEVDQLAWPFGIYDDQLLAKAAASGYRVTLSVNPKPVTAADSVHILPRFLLSEGDKNGRFVKIVSTASGG